MHQSDVELTISRFSKIEQRLVTDLGATEKNGATRTPFISRLSEVEHLFTAATVQRLRSIASLRNRVCWLSRKPLSILGLTSIFALVDARILHQIYQNPCTSFLRQLIRSVKN